MAHTPILAGVDKRELEELLPFMSEEDRAAVDELLTVGLPVWMPQVGPQTIAADSLADEVLYGGAAGGGKTDLEIGLALTRHHRSIIFRREAVQMIAIEERVAEILGTREGFNGQDNLVRLPDAPGLPTGRVLEFGAVKDANSWKKYQGRPHDLICFDEAEHFLETQVRSLIAWNRSKYEGRGVRCRVVMASNPPTTSEGEWIIRYFAPWLDPEHANPAKPGELRWFVTGVDGKDMEVPSGKPVKVGSKWVRPRSRTFIPSKLKDNVFLAGTNYDSVLDSLPEPLRSQMRDGDFLAGRRDDVWQMVPSAWVRAAQARWQPRDIKGVMTACGLDVARGGRDQTSLARRHDLWFDEILTVPGIVTDDGPKAAAWLVQHLRGGCPVGVDSIGVGASALDFAKAMNLRVVPINASEAVHNSMDKTGNLRFKNRRARMYWRLREALDPANENPIALPPDPELFQDLTAVRYKVVTHGRFAAIQARDKDEIRELLGRSPDKGDAVAFCFDDDLPMAAFGEDAAAFRRKRGLKVRTR